VSDEIDRHSDHVGQFDQVAIRIAQINTSKFPSRASPFYHPTAFENFHFLLIQILNDLIHVLLDKETEICTTWLNDLGFGLEFLASDVQVDLLVSE